MSCSLKRQHFLLLLCMFPIATLRADQREDEALLKQANIPLTASDLLQFLEQRTPSESDLEKIKQQIRQLGSDEFEEREAASRWLTVRGRTIVPFLKPALKDPDAEIANRAKLCLNAILDGPDLARVKAVLRLLAQRRPKGTTGVVLRYLPFEDDESVRDVALNALLGLQIRDGVTDPDLIQGLNSRQAVIRGACAYVLGRSSEREVQQQVVLLLRDPDMGVRFQACQGLLAGKNPQSVIGLIELLERAESDLAWRSEAILFQLAQEQAPQESYGKGTPKEREAWKNAWVKWWEANRGKVDLASFIEKQAILGFTLVAEMHGGRIWEADRHGNVRWEINNLTQPRDAILLSNGRVLVAEASANRVTERDRSGKILWSHNFKDPAYIKRLPNGNTVLGNHNKAVEVTEEGREVFSYSPTPQFLIHSMFHKDNGNLVLCQD